MIENMTGKRCFRVDAKSKRISAMQIVTEHEKDWGGSFREWCCVRACDANGKGLVFSLSRLVFESDPRFDAFVVETTEKRIPCPHCAGRGYTVEGEMKDGAR